MRFLIYGINYAPELTGVGKYTGEMTEWLKAQGHEVRVVTAPPYYPAWQIGAGYSARRYCKEFLQGVEVWRCPLWIPRQPSGLKRILHLASFAISSLPLMLWQGLFWRPDVVFVVEPAFFCVIGALLTSLLNGAKTWLHIQDFEIDAGFEMGILPSSKFLRSLSMTIERWLMNRFNRVSTISDRMLNRLKVKGVDMSKCVYFPNWVDTDNIYPLQKTNILRNLLDIPSDTFVALYSGSMVEKQGLDILISAAKLLATDYPKILFVLCGEGSAKKRLLKLATGMCNIRFLDLQPSERLNALLNLANVHLLPQIPDAADLVMPSKLLGMCASGQPVIGTVHYGTQVAELLKNCGIVVSPGDVTAISNAIVYLATHPDQCHKLGQAARQLTVDRWHKEKVLQQFERKLVALYPSPILENISVAPAIFSSLETDIQKNILPTAQNKPIGSYLVESGLITKLQLDIALTDQQITGMRLGEIIVEYSWLNQLTIDELMSNVVLPEREAILKQ
ncbi:glycosyltransferase WbuB [Chlorogloea sp. CCALA 695]|uniref:glycosyltransferase WbuB n=1 Tax=Chlorogloea sp. CCALA 695 TaxID=2107693 RepID=UPI000D068806|nr:glycosyltransferase WbuB [Chlorogloea sp. CCALA 695]PSB29495.1 colanic acid biosynthesis glycosyltransferase WcaI [Chlorogloea sp. CCALA 695]